MAVESSADTSESWLRKATWVLDNYVSLQLVFIGVLLMIAGYLIQFIEANWTETGVWAVVLALWGATLVLLGTTLYALIWFSHQGGTG